MKNYKESDLYKLGLQFKAIGKVLTDENSTMAEVIKAFDESPFGVDFRLAIRGEE